MAFRLTFTAAEEWQIHQWVTDVEVVLTAALRPGDDEASEAARALINRLGARGFLQYRSLLNAGAE